MLNGKGPLNNSPEPEGEEINIPVVKQLVRLSKRIRLPGLDGLTLYDFNNLYLAGIVEGTFSPRASSIAYSFFVALFPFLLFIGYSNQYCLKNNPYQYFIILAL